MNKKLILALSIFASVCTINTNSAKAQDVAIQSVAQQGQTEVCQARRGRRAAYERQAKHFGADPDYQNRGWQSGGQL